MNARRLAPLAALLLAALAGSAATRPVPVLSYLDAALTAQDGRSVPVRLVYQRGLRQALRLAVFSHGAASEPARYDALSQVLARRGYLVVAPLHRDSPWHPFAGAVPLVDPVASWSLRIADMQLALHSDVALTALSGARIDHGSALAVGHSYGALVAQALGGATLTAAPSHSDRDPRAAVVVAFSPPGPIPGYIERVGWRSVAVPMLVVTGTADVVPPIAQNWQDHLASWEETPAPRLLLVANGADHYFGNLIGRPERPPPSEAVAAAFAAAARIAADFGGAAVGDGKWPRPATIAARYPALFTRIEAEPRR